MGRAKASTDVPYMHYCTIEHSRRKSNSPSNELNFWYVCKLDQDTVRVSRPSMSLVKLAARPVQWLASWVKLIDLVCSRVRKQCNAKTAAIEL